MPKEVEKPYIITVHAEGRVYQDTATRRGIRTTMADLLEHELSITLASAVSNGIIKSYQGGFFEHSIGKVKVIIDGE